METAPARIRGGRITVALDRPGPAELVLRIDGEEIGRLARRGDLYEGPVPAAVLNDGITVLVVTAPGDETVLARLPLVMGEVLSDDVQTQLSLLRAEIAMLKAALRRAQRR